jgi:hypothetical protein
MASCQREVLQTRTASIDPAATTGEAVTLPPRSHSCIGELIVTACHADITISSEIQHSADNSNWYTYLSFSNVAGTTAIEAKYPVNASVLPYVRAKSTFTGATAGKSATISIKLFFQPN